MHRYQTSRSHFACFLLTALLIALCPACQDTAVQTSGPKGTESVEVGTSAPIEVEGTYYDAGLQPLQRAAFLAP